MEIISYKDCVKVIQNYLKVENVVVHSFEILPIFNDHTGYLGEYHRLRIKFDDIITGTAAVKQFFVKSLPIENLERRKVVNQLGFFKKEQLLYKTLVPKLKKYSGDKKWCPDCYLSKADHIILEDLEIEDYEIAPIHFEFTTSHIEEALKTLASFHMSSIIYEKLELKPSGTNIGEKYGHMLIESFRPENEWFQCGIQATKSVALTKTKYGIGTKYEKLIESHYDDKVKKIYEIVHAPEAKVPKIWCNRDIWKNNLMYKFEKLGNGKSDFSKPLDCILVDYQISRYMPLTTDVLILIIDCTRREHYEKHMDHYLEFYYECLKTELLKHEVKIEQVMKWEDFKDGCDDVMLVPLLINPLFISLTHLPSGVLANLSKNNVEEYQKALNVKREDLIYEYMEKDSYYRDCMIEVTEALIEYLFDIKE